MRKTIVFAMCLFILALTRGVRADEMSELKEQMRQMQQRLDQLETSRENQDKQINEKISQMVEARQADAVPQSLKWAEKIKFSGDLRYRHETIDSQSSGKDKDGTNRNRIRARLGLSVNINEEWDLGFRFATGSSDPSSTNQTLENGFSSKDVWLDLAYFDWHPQSVERLNVYGGKMPNPFYTAGKNQLIWDGDVTPEGIAAKYSMPMWGENNTLYINGGGFWLKPDTGAEGAASVWGVQGYMKHTFENKDYMLGGLSYYIFGNLEGKEGLYKSSGSGASKFGNTMTGSGTTASPYRYAGAYKVLEAFGEYGFKLADKPSNVYGSFIKNTAAVTSEDTGWLIGINFNKAKDPGSWQLGYNYRKVEKDATIGVLTDSDFVGGGTDGKGHCFTGTYQLTKNIQAGLTYFLSEKGPTEDKYRRIMADLIFKF
jgi:hypothetical protein